MNPMVFNPAHAGAAIDCSIGGYDILIPSGEAKSVPLTAVKELLARYPWLHEVVDGPSSQPMDSLPSAVVDEPADAEPAPEQPEASPEAPEAAPAEADAEAEAETAAEPLPSKEEVIEVLEAKGIEFDRRLGVKKLLELIPAEDAE